MERSTAARARASSCLSTASSARCDPLPGALFVLLELALQDVLVGDGNGHLGLHLEQLVLHVQDDLFDHFFGVFGLIDKVVEIGANQG